MPYNHWMQAYEDINQSGDQRLVSDSNGRTIEEKVAQAQARHIHRELLPTVIAGGGTATLVLTVFAKGVGAAHMAAFLSTLAILGLFSYTLWYLFRLPVYTTAQVRRLLQLASAYFAVTSAVWAFGVYVFFPAEHYPQRLALFVAFLMSSTASVFSLGAYLPAFIAAMIPMGAIVITILALQGPLADPLLATVVLFVPIILAIAVRFNRLLLISLRTGFKNIDLVSQLTLERNKANKTSMEKSLFLAMANHDLRQPMHALNLYLGVLSEHPLPEQSHPIVANMKLCSAAMEGLFKTLLNIWRLDSGVIEVKTSSFPIQILLNQVQVEFEPLATAQNLTLRVAPSSLWTQSDPELLGQIARNLMSNALRYTPSGKVLIGCRRTPAGMCLQVWDTGMGIAVESQQKIFEEFCQLKDPKGSHLEGSGLGLAIVQRLANALGTKVSLRSVPGKGSVFSVDLPVVPGEHLHLPAALDELNTQAEHLNGAKPLVIAIDNDPHILLATQLTLEKAGFSVIAAGSGATAMALLGKVSSVPVAIVCDYRLGDNEFGFDVIAAIREEFNTDIPAMMVTGEASLIREESIGRRTLPVLAKPVQAATLVTSLRTLLLATRHKDLKSK